VKNKWDIGRWGIVGPPGGCADLFSTKSKKMAIKRRKPACFQSHAGIYARFL
jgi:hypothetical protein